MPWFPVHALRNTNLGNNLSIRMQKENRYLLDSDNENPGFHKMTTLKNNKVLDNDVR